MFNKIKSIYPEITKYEYDYCYRLALTDLYTNYRTITYFYIVGDTKEFAYEDLPYPAITINKCGCPFRLTSTHIIGKDILKYIDFTYIPSIHNYDDEEIIYYMILAEYCLSKGQFIAADEWNISLKKKLNILN